MTNFEGRKKFFAKYVDWMTDKYGMKALGIEPYYKAMRGGIEGAALSWRGLITPNIFIGGHNYHGRFEFVSVQVMEKATEVVLKMLELAGK